jgi:hypothetical protein
MKRDFQISQTTICSTREIDGSLYSRQLEGLKDAKRIANELNRLGYSVKNDDITMQFPRGYSDVSKKDVAANKFDGKMPDGYKIKGNGITLKIENFARERNPGMLGGECRWGVKGYIEMDSSDKKKIDGIVEMIGDYLSTRCGYKRETDLLDILKSTEKEDKFIRGFMQALLSESFTVFPPFPEPKKDVLSSPIKI